ncbi:MAG TPA: T9SS type A sorting domain-containing protein [Flavobacterium sp.]|nr:T9SS type A sorting domain-containing protein [Flavobacterium sp.]
MLDSSTNPRTIKPTSGSILPGTVSVTPYVNDVAYPTKTCTISRAPITSGGSITGSSTVCASSTYSLTGLSSGQSVTWSLSNSTAGTLSTTTGASTTFTKTGGGSVNLAATVSNSCGQSYQPTPKSLFVGSPQAFSLVRASNETCDTKYHYVPFEIPNRNPLITYTFNVPPIPGISVTQSTQTYNGVLQNVLRFPKTYVGFVDFTVSTTNSCGSFAYYAEEQINSCSGMALAAETSTYTLEQTTMYSVYPNPSSDVINVNLREENNIPETQTPIVATLYNLMGEEKRNVTIKNNIATIPVNNLPKGIYILKINIDGTIENHQVVVE